MLAGSAAACSSGGLLGVGTRELDCGSLDKAFLADGGVGRDGIPSLTDPPFAALDDSVMTGYLTDNDRVIGVQAGGEWLAIPHNVMYRHEIVNLNRGSEQIVVTYCPLTGSALAFDRTPLGGAEFGVSGILYQANLIMYDRSADDSLWPQMAGVAGCGPRAGQSLVRLQVVEMTWGGWKELFPGSKVVEVDLGEVERYSYNPYGASYEHPANSSYLGFPISSNDGRRPPKERVLGFPADQAQSPLAFPFGAMEARGEVWFAEFEYKGAPAVVLWDAARGAALPARPSARGQRLTFDIRDGAIVDNETGSTWSVAGRAMSGPLTGERLAPIPEAYIAFWRPWVAYHPGTELVVE